MVARQGWLSDRQFADAVAIGKLTPGPVLLLATFIGSVPPTPRLKRELLGLRD